MAGAEAGSNWTDEENDLLVADYFAMLGEQFAGRPSVKAHTNAAIVATLGRCRQSVDFKYRNVSAILTKLGMPRLPDHPARQIDDLLPWNWKERQLAERQIAVTVAA
jgi:hypothetical protein